jgi:hypothetical protein
MFLILFIAIVLEVLIGSLGIIAPFTALALFYFVPILGKYPAISTAIITGFFIDDLYGRTFICTPITLTIVVIVAYTWIVSINSRNNIFHSIPGIFIAIIYIAPLTLISLFKMAITKDLIIQNGSILIIGILISSISLPVLITLLDFLSKQLGFELFKDYWKKHFQGGGNQ